MLLPSQTSLGRLRLVEVLDAFDGPRLIVAKNATGLAFLGLWVEDIESKDIWLYVAVSGTRLEQVRTGQVSLRDAYLEPEEGCTLRVEIERETGESTLRVVRPDELLVEDLPPENDFLDLPSKTPPHTYPQEAVASGRSNERSVERLHIAPSRPHQLLGNDAVAAIWGRWHHCRQSSLRTQGSRGTTKLPALGVALRSFAVDLSVPHEEPYFRTVAGWANFIKSAGKSNIRNRLIECGIESTSCEALLHAITHFEIVFTVTLSHSDDDKVYFTLDEKTAASLLDELRSISPVLTSEKIPQADDLIRIHLIVKLLLEHGEVSEEQAGLVHRQINYYKHAARILGLIDYSDMVTVAGRLFVAAKEGLSRVHILRTQFEASECGWAWMRWAGKDSLGAVDTSSAEKFLRSTVPGLSENTAQRRAKTLRNWHGYCFPPMPTLFDSSNG